MSIEHTLLPDSDVESEVWDFAAEIATELTPPQRVYVLDVCETEDGYRLLELNPFSGADLYGCDLDAVVAAVAGVVAKEPGRSA
jgi:hypothetical protein